MLGITGNWELGIDRQRYPRKEGAPRPDLSRQSPTPKCASALRNEVQAGRTAPGRRSQDSGRQNRPFRIPREYTTAYSAVGIGQKWCCPRLYTNTGAKESTLYTQSKNGSQSRSDSQVERSMSNMKAPTRAEHVFEASVLALSLRSQKSRGRRRALQVHCEILPGSQWALPDSS